MTRLFCILLLTVKVRATMEGKAVDFYPTQSESDDFYHYSDESYHQLEEEYKAAFLQDAETTSRDEMKPFEIESVQYSETDESGGEKMLHDKTIIATTLKVRDLFEQERHFLERAQNIQCDDPWFWYTFECVILDIKNRHYSKRLKSNATISGAIIGSILLVLFGGSLYLYCYAKIQFGLMFKKFRNISKTYTEIQKPGVIVLPDGEVRHYEPTQEEQEALEKLMEVLATVN